MVTPEAVLEIQVETLRRVIRQVFRHLLGPAGQEELRAMLRSDLLHAFENINHESLTELERTLLAHAIEELVTIRSTLPVGTGSA